MENERRIDLGFDDYIFISYAHLDNTGVVEGHRGWVDVMHKYLAQRVPQFLGKKTGIFRDPQLTGNDPFHDALREKLSRIEILVAVLSPPYVESEECLKELRQFYQRLAEAGGPDTKARIFKVVKLPIEDCEDPKELQGLLGYKFYEVDQSGRPREFSHEFAYVESHQKFANRVDDLAYDIKQFIKRYRPSASGPLPNPNTRTIYLAEVESDLEEKRDSIKRELVSQGHQVLPDKDLPRDVTRLEQMVREDLRRSFLSLHLIGENYGFIPDKERVRSSVRLQYELALEHSKSDSSFTQLIWMPRGLETQDDRQTAFLEYLRTDVGIQPRTELLQDKLEDLKKDVLDRIKSSFVPAKPKLVENVASRGTSSGQSDAPSIGTAPPPQEEPLRAYLICDGSDYDATEPLSDYLFTEQFEVIRPLQEGNTAERLQDHNEQLSTCDVAIVFHGQANEIWMRQKLLDLRKIAGNDPSRKFLAKAVYLAAPNTRQKDTFRTLEAKVIRDSGDFPANPPKDLVQFLELVRNTVRERVRRAHGVG